MNTKLFLAPFAAVTLAALTFPLAGPAQAQTDFVVKSATVAPPRPASAYSEAELHALGEGVVFPYDLLDTVLQKDVNDKGLVDYSRVKGDNNLELFVRTVNVANLETFPVFTRPADPLVAGSKPGPDNTPELTFWIDAYDGLFLKAVADAYPFGNLGSVAGFNTAVTHVVAGKAYSFDQLRQHIGAMDPRALFALPSGTLDGPMQLRQAYRYANLNQDLDGAVLRYINDNRHVSYPDRDENTVTVARWLQTVDSAFRPADTRAKWAGIRVVLRKYTGKKGSGGGFGGDTSARNYLITHEFEIKFMPANNTLNDQASNQ